MTPSLRRNNCKPVFFGIFFFEKPSIRGSRTREDTEKMFQIFFDRFFVTSVLFIPNFQKQIRIKLAISKFHIYHLPISKLPIFKETWQKNAQIDNLTLYLLKGRKSLPSFESCFYIFSGFLLVLSDDILIL